MSDVIRNIRERFIDERVHGYADARGRQVTPISAAEAAKRWEKVFPRFVNVLRTPGIAGVKRLNLGRGPEAPVPEPLDGMSAENWARDYEEKSAQRQVSAERNRIENDQPRRQAQRQPQAAQAAQPPQARKAKRIYPERTARSAEEEDWFGSEQESVYTLAMKAQNIVGSLLEDDYDAHVKAHEKVQTWDKAHQSARKLLGLKMKSLDKFRELGRAIGYERALARIGLTRKDVAATIYGAQIGSTHNYKKTRTSRRCNNVHCRDRGEKPEAQADCATCGEALVTKQVPYSFTDLHGKLSRHMLGVETQDGRRIWFDEPLAPSLEPESESEAVKPAPKATESEKRLGKWW